MSKETDAAIDKIALSARQNVPVAEHATIDAAVVLAKAFFEALQTIAWAAHEIASHGIRNRP